MPQVRRKRRTVSETETHRVVTVRGRILAVLNIAMADTAFTIWSAQRFYGSIPVDVTWRPVT